MLLKGSADVDMDREYIGFASLPDQIHRKTIKKGFEFTLMVAGESGLGKSTLVNTLFLTNLYQDRIIPPVEGIHSIRYEGVPFPEPLKSR